MTDPILWYLNRGTGVSLMVLLSATTVLGVLATGRQFFLWWPRFVTQGLHRALAGISLGLLAVHAISAVIDEYVDIRWWQALLPWGASYKPLWLSLGTLALNLLVVLGVTTALRSRLPHRVWFLTHLLSYAAWAASVIHGIGIGTDTHRDWMSATTLACAAAVVAATLFRAGVAVRDWWERRSTKAWT